MIKRNNNKSDYLTDCFENKMNPDKSSSFDNECNVVCYLQSTNMISLNDLFMIFIAERFAHQNSGKVFLLLEDSQLEYQTELDDALKYVGIYIDDKFHSVSQNYLDEIQINYVFKDFSDTKDKNLKFFNMKNQDYINFTPVFKQSELTEETDVSTLRYLIQQGYPGSALKEYLISCAYNEFRSWRDSHPNLHCDEFPINLKYSQNTYNLFDIYKLDMFSKTIISKMAIEEIFQSAFKWALKFNPKLAERMDSNPKCFLDVFKIGRGHLRSRKDLAKWTDIPSISEYYFDDYYYKLNLDFTDNLPVEKIKEILKGYSERYDAALGREAWWEQIESFAEELGFTSDKKLFSEHPEDFAGEIGNLLSVLRIAITGRASAPDLYDIQQILGREAIIQRLQHCLKLFEETITVNYNINNQLVDFARKLTCNFIDHHTITKDAVKKFSFRYKEELEKADYKGFIVATCLRFEFYDFSGSKQLQEGSFYAPGLFALRRLLSLMCGLQSELLGEREILMQTRKAIDTSLAEGRIDETDYQTIENLIQISLKIRKDYAIETNENYSTIASKMFRQKLNWDRNPVIMIVGAGYMAVEFFNSIYEHCNKIIWVNRDASKVKRYVDSCKERPNQKIIVSDLESCRTFLPLLDGLFVAISNSFNYFTEKDINMLPEDALIIDISYPEVVPATDNHKLHNIKNTNFNEYLDSPIPRQSIRQAYSKIEDIAEEIGKRL